MERSGGLSSSVKSGGAKILESKPLSVDQDKKKQQKQLILLAILICVLVYFVYTNILAPKKKVGSVSGKHESEQVIQPASYPTDMTVLSSSDQESNSGLDALLKEDGWDRNPFTLGGEEVEEEVTNNVLRLDGIIFDGNDSYAIISKKIVKQGDRLADKVVKEIRENEVLLRTDDGQFIELKMN